MDASRQADLKRIDDRLNTKRTQSKAVIHDNGEIERVETYNQKTDKWAKDQAARAKDSIIRQSRDKKLTHLRNQLIRAVRAGDRQAELQISAKIKHYQKEPFENYE